MNWVAGSRLQVSGDGPSTAASTPPLRTKADGPNPYVLMAVFHRMHEWEKELADHAVQVKALEMRGKKSFTTKGTKVHKGRAFLQRKAVKA